MRNHNKQTQTTILRPRRRHVRLFDGNPIMPPGLAHSPTETVTRQGPIDHAHIPWKTTSHRSRHVISHSPPSGDKSLSPPPPLTAFPPPSPSPSAPSVWAASMKDIRVSAPCGLTPVSLWPERSQPDLRPLEAPVRAAAASAALRTVTACLDWLIGLFFGGRVVSKHVSACSALDAVYYIYVCVCALFVYERGAWVVLFVFRCRSSTMPTR